ncbi:flagellar M-ring protein FliF [Paraneptunicella aestuarii]|uniref:flagellar basal-body MS-ring/collar protein FliF n=1 Tax=Paraneptunicella aestuarii TaxID=2831148 RepID=UPI001E332B31|nr:flagellar basal-body MS-ring/collar protein FliF [Paraneptunicella aestuarii]UAA37592.1 flagellar M-ring protein FliF [Paraneptunicella aestuarii]
MVDVINEFSPAKRTMFFGTVIILICAFIGVAIWLLYPKQKPLFEQLNEQSAAQAIAYLEESKVPYELVETPSGHTISVAEEQVERLKVTMRADLGLPQIQGLELFENTDYSMTDFTQEVTYKRALQGELARTISSMPGVASARVHITFAPKRLFSSAQEQAKSAVYLELLQDVKLDEAQIQAVQVLVANAVESLEVQNVAVFDDSGILISNVNDSSTKSMSKQIAAKQEIEQQLVAKAYKLLSLAISPENIAVSVDVTLNFDQRKQLVQDYIANAEGEGAIVRKVESQQNQEHNPTRKSNVENTLTRESETEYQHGKRTEEVVFSAGEIKVMNVAVALREDLHKDEVATIKDLLIAGLGVNTYRGDNIAVAVLKDRTAVLSVKNEEPHSPAVQLSQTTDIKSANSNPESNSWAGLSSWWLLLLLVIPGVWVITRQPALSQDEREKLLLEAQQWLSQDEVKNGN